MRYLGMNLRLFRTKVLMASLSILLSLGAVEITLRLLDIYSPATFHRMPANSELRDTQTDWNVVYRTNSLGMRDEEHFFSKPQGTTRIVLIGDSYTFGQGVQRGELFSDVLRTTLQAEGYPVEIINISDIGIGPEAYFVLFKEIAAKYHPDLVILNVFGNDASQLQQAPLLNRLVREGSHYSNLFTLLRLVRRQVSVRMQRDYWGTLASQTKANEQESELAKQRVAEFKKEYGSDVNNLLATCITEPDDVARWINTNSEGAGWADFEKYILAIRDISRQLGCKLLIDIVPDGPQVDPKQFEIRHNLGVPIEASVLTDKGGFQTLVHRFADRNGIPCLDPLEDFRRVRDGLYFKTDFHWTPMGHRLYAQVLAEYLQDQQLIKQ